MSKDSRFEEIIRDNFTVKVISLFLAIVIFAWVRTDQESTVTTNIPVRLVLPSGTMIIGGNAPEVVGVSVRGRESDLNRFNRNQLNPIILNVSVADHERPIEIPYTSISTPSGVRVVKIVPSEIVVQIDNEAEKLVPIKTRVIGTPKEPFHLGVVTVNPKSIRVTGPKTLLAGLDEIVTEAIDVTGQSTTMTRRVRLRIDDPLVTYDPTTAINVRLDISAQYGNRVISGLPIVDLNAPGPMLIEPDTIELELKGPKALLNKINTDTIHVTVDLAGKVFTGDEKKALKVRVRDIPDGLVLVKSVPETVNASRVVLDLQQDDE